MVSQGELKAKVLFVLIAHPLTAVPFLVGATAMVLDRAGVTGGLPLMFFGLLAILGSMGAFLTRFIFSREAVAKKVLDELEEEAERARETALDDLERRLSRDRDRRDERLLADLRTIARGFRESRSLLGTGKALSALEIYDKVEELFSVCVRSLEHGLKLLELAKDLTTEQVAEELRRRRERILEDVEASVSKLGAILTEIGRLSEGDEQGSELRRIREELDSNIAIAKRVEERMRSIDGDPARDVE